MLDSKNPQYLPELNAMGVTQISYLVKGRLYSQLLRVWAAENSWLSVFQQLSLAKARSLTPSWTPFPEAAPI